MSIKIVSDSSSNVFTLAGVNYATVPMKVIAGDKEYVDTPDLDVRGMVDDLKAYKGKSGSSCPNVQEWLDVFGDGDDILGITISRNLSGSYNSALEAARQYQEEHPERRVHIFDSLTAGPHQIMAVEKMQELIEAGCDFDTIVEKTNDYLNRTHILFCLESMTNLARNGRVSPAVAKIAGVLGIRACGDAPGGIITPVHKPRGEKKATQALLDMMEEKGIYDGAMVRIAHCFGEKQANALKELVLAKYPNCRFILEPTGGLCSFYAEAGGLMIGFEGGFHQYNSEVRQ